MKKEKIQGSISGEIGRRCSVVCEIEIEREGKRQKDRERGKETEGERERERNIYPREVSLSTK